MDQESVNDEKIALVHEHNRALITSTSAREVARTSARRLSHPARAEFLDFFSLPPIPQWSPLGVQILGALPEEFES